MENDALEPRLEQAQRALQVALDQTCNVDVDEVDTGEMIRIEAALAQASQAAKDVVSMRLRRRRRRAIAAASIPPDEVSREPEVSPSIITRRIFDDIRGTRWQVYAVRPSQEHALPPDYQSGWLVFESATDVLRVAPIPDNWIELTIDDLRTLCRMADIARARRRATPRSGTPQPPDAT